jgi:hypothetical protein
MLLSLPSWLGIFPPTHSSSEAIADVRVAALSAPHRRRSISWGRRGSCDCLPPARFATTSHVPYLEMVGSRHICFDAAATATLHCKLKPLGSVHYKRQECTLLLLLLLLPFTRSTGLCKLRPVYYYFNPYIMMGCWFVASSDDTILRHCLFLVIYLCASCTLDTLQD